MQANNLDEDFFRTFSESFNDLDWHYEYIESLIKWSQAADEFRKAMIRLMPLSDSDLEKFIAQKVPDNMKNKVRDEVTKLKGEYSDDFRYRKLKWEYFFRGLFVAGLYF